MLKRNILSSENVIIILADYIFFLLVIRLNSGDYGLNELSISPVYVHFIILTGYLILISNNEGVFVHCYCRFRYANKISIFKCRMKRLFAETLIFWIPFFILKTIAGLFTEHKVLLVIACINVFINLLTVGIAAEFISVYFGKSYIGSLIVFLVLCIDYLFVTGMFYLDFSFFYFYMLEPFVLDSVLEITIEIGNSLIKCFAVFCITFIMCYLNRLRTLKTILVNWKVIILGAIALGVILGVYGKAVSAGDVETVLLVLLGGLIYESGFGIWEFMIYILPFIVQLAILAGLLPEGMQSASAYVLTRESSGNRWLIRCILELSAASITFYIFMIVGILVTVFISGTMVGNIISLLKILGSLLLTGGLIQLLCVISCNLVGVWLGKRIAFIITAGIFITGYWIASLPSGFLTGIIKMIFPITHGIFLIHNPDNNTTQYEFLFHYPEKYMRITFTVLYEILWAGVICKISGSVLKTRDYL